MAEFSMWGPQESGTRLAAKDQQATLQSDLAALHTMGQIRAQPGAQALQEAHARLYGAEADLKGMDLDIRKRMMAQFSAMGEGQPVDDPLDMMTRVGSMQLQSGDFTHGSDTLAKVDLIRTRRARAAEQLALAEKAKLDTQAKGLEIISNMTGAIRNQADLDRMFLQGSSMGPQVAAAMGQIPRDYASARAVLDQISASTLKAADRMRAQHWEVDRTRQEAEAADRQATRATTRAVNSARKELIDERTEALRKNSGGKPLGAAPTNELDQAKVFIKQQLGVKGDVEGLGAGASELASEALRLRRQNPALSFTQSLAQAYNPKDWETQKNNFSANGAKYTGGPGKTPKTAIPLPMKGREIDTANVRENTHYTTTDGKVWMRKGDQMVEVPR